MQERGEERGGHTRSSALRWRESSYNPDGSGYGRSAARPGATVFATMFSEAATGGHYSVCVVCGVYVLQMLRTLSRTSG